MLQSNAVTNQTFTYDRWGNRSASTLALSFNSATNRITTTGYNSYDSAGNQLGLPGFTLQYDGASRIKTVNSGSTATYTYDGDGRRVKKVAGGVTTYYFYDPEGNATWEYKVGTGWETFNLFFNGKHAAINNTAEGLRWRHLDHLGNLVLKTNNAGVDVCRYYTKPYGELNSRTCTEGDDYWFTGKERDAETGLDCFGARYHGSAIGRFTSSDPIGGFTEVPQSLNKYSYGLNNPLRYTDQDGLMAVPVIPLGGILIGGVWGGIDAYINQTGYGKGIFSGAMGGLAASMTYPVNPIYAGAISGGVTNISGQLYDTAFTEKTWRDIDLVSLGIDTTMGALIGRVLGPVTTTIQRWKWQGLIPPRPGSGLVPARFTTYYGPKAKDLHRAFGLSGFFGSSYHMATHEIGSTYTPADLFSFRLRLLEGIARGSHL